MFYTEKELSGLVGYLAFDTRPIFDYTPPPFRKLDKTKQPSYKIKTMDAKMQTLFNKMQIELIEENKKTGKDKSAVDILIKLGVKGWANVRTARGDTVDFEMNGDDMLSEKSLLSMQSLTKLTLYKVILGEDIDN